MLVHRRNKVYRELLLAAVEAVIDLSRILVLVLVVRVADLLQPQRAIECQLFQLGQHVADVDIGVLDFLLDVFFLVGQVFELLAVALDVGLLLQLVQRAFDLLLELADVLVEALEHQHAQVVDSGLEFAHVLDQEQRLEQAHGEFILKISFGEDDRLLKAGLECGADAFEHQIKRCQLANFVVFD